LFNFSHFTKALGYTGFGMIGITFYVMFLHPHVAYFLVLQIKPLCYQTELLTKDWVQLLNTQMCEWSVGLDV